MDDFHWLTQGRHIGKRHDVTEEDRNAVVLLWNENHINWAEETAV